MKKGLLFLVACCVTMGAMAQMRVLSNGTVAVIGNGLLIMPNHSQITVENGGKFYYVLNKNLTIMKHFFICYFMYLDSVASPNLAF